jgi:hypothetical protein
MTRSVTRIRYILTMSSDILLWKRSNVQSVITTEPFSTERAKRMDMPEDVPLISDERSTLLNTDALETELLHWLLQPSVQHALHWIRVDLTLKQRVRKIAAPLVRHLNVHFFRGRARRRSNPDKLVCLIVQHDVGTRRQLNMLFALPPTVTVKDFKQALRHVLKHEPFVFPNAVDDERSCRIEEVKDLRKSVFDNVNERKSLTRVPILYMYPSRSTSSTATGVPLRATSEQRSR